MLNWSFIIVDDLAGPRAVQRYEMRLALWDARGLPLGDDYKSVMVEACIHIFNLFLNFDPAELWITNQSKRQTLDGTTRELQS